VGRFQPGSSDEDPYLVLGVNSGASRQEIARAYRRAVHGTHPDARPHDPRARARFEALTDAYDLLSDPARRADYDSRHVRADAIKRPDAATAGMPSGTPVIWAGPVHVAPGPVRPASGRPEAHFEDPPVLLGSGRRPREGRP
jgi:curved DNA-binding protein CbpA